VDAEMTKESVIRIKTIKKQLEMVASGEDPEILFENIEDIHNCCYNKSLVNTFEEVDLTDPFPDPPQSPSRT
jgi:hypothetical protein